MPEIEELLKDEKYDECEKLAKTMLQKKSKDACAWYTLFVLANENYYYFDCNNIKHKEYLYNATKYAKKDLKEQIENEYKFYNALSPFLGISKVYRLLSFGKKEEAYQFLGHIISLDYKYISDGKEDEIINIFNNYNHDMLYEPINLIICYYMAYKCNKLKGLFDYYASKINSNIPVPAGDISLNTVLGYYGLFSDPKLVDSDYKKALDYFKQKNYAEALYLFNLHSDYKDSLSYIEKCNIELDKEDVRKSFIGKAKYNLFEKKPDSIKTKVLKAITKVIMFPVDLILKLVSIIGKHIPDNIILMLFKSVIYIIPFSLAIYSGIVMFVNWDNLCAVSNIPWTMIGLGAYFVLSLIYACIMIHYDKDEDFHLKKVPIIEMVVIIPLYVYVIILLTHIM